MELFRRFLKTASYEAYVHALKSNLESRGIRTDIFGSKLPNQFVVCMWSSGRRKNLAKQLLKYDAIVVLGCDAAVETVRNCTESCNCRVIAGMVVEGIMNVIPYMQFPLNIYLKVHSVTRVLQYSTEVNKK